MIGKNGRVLLYFLSWVSLGSVCVVLNILNIDWDKTNTIQGILIVILLGILQVSVLEFPIQTIATLVVGGEQKRIAKVAHDETTTLLLDYNLLAYSKMDIDECIKNMFDAYMGSLATNISAVLISATPDEELKRYEREVQHQYRTKIYHLLLEEGIRYIKNQWDDIDKGRLQRVWRKFDTHNSSMRDEDFLDNICEKFAKEFMVIHRVSRVLKKCGQYQDLLLLSHGDDEAFTYTDVELYGSLARPYNEPLFHESEDVNNIFGRKFDYTLILDGDTRVPEGAALELLDIANAQPHKGIIQPAIKLHCVGDDTDTMFMHLENMRQCVYEPMTNAVTAILGQSGFFGKGMIKNSIYIEKVIGIREKPIERIPIDVLSHDTFEAALLQPYYVGSVHLLETPSYNYVSWNIRESRWNRGEVLLAMYFWKHLVGKPMRLLQQIFRGSDFVETKLRTESHLDFVSSYIAHSALRLMFMKPFLLLYIIVHINISLKYTYAAIISIMFFVLVFPKIATCSRHNYKYVLLETVASISQFTPESLVGCVRIIRAIRANICVGVKWIPQRVIEEDIKNSNPFMSSLKHLWCYSIFAIICGSLQIYFIPECMLLFVMLVTLFLLPFFSGLTSLNTSFQTVSSVREKEQNVGISSPSPNDQDDSASHNTYMRLSNSDLSPPRLSSSDLSPLINNIV